MSTKANRESRIKKCIKAVIRVVSKARGCYVRSLTHCSGRIGYGSSVMVSCPAFTQISSLPRSFSAVSSGDDDFRELMRIASRRSLLSKMELELMSQKSLDKNGVNVVHRTHSVAIGRIDEEEPCDFGEDVMVNPRSRSYAVSSKQNPIKKI